MNDSIRELYEVILSRKESADESSYTGYLFREGINKILKKIGEESSEVIIAAKTLEAAEQESEVKHLSRSEVEEVIKERKLDLENEFVDLLYHLLVLMVERDVPLEELEKILQERSEKAGNLKKMKVVDKNS